MNILKFYTKMNLICILVNKEKLQMYYLYRIDFEIIPEYRANWNEL